MGETYSQDKVLDREGVEERELVLGRGDDRGDHQSEAHRCEGPKRRQSFLFAQTSLYDLTL